MYAYRLRQLQGEGVLRTERYQDRDGVCFRCWNDQGIRIQARLINSRGRQSS